MNDVSFRFHVKSKRDLLRVRQLARQAAALLGFSRDEQTCLAAAAFDLACQAYRATRRASVTFDASEGVLHLGFRALTPKSRQQFRIRRSFQLVRKLPEDARVSFVDLPWALKQLAQHAPLELFDEMVTINRELLQALLDQTARPATIASRAA